MFVAVGVRECRDRAPTELLSGLPLEIVDIADIGDPELRSQLYARAVIARDTDDEDDQNDNVVIRRWESPATIAQDIARRLRITIDAAKRLRVAGVIKSIN